MPVKRWPTLRFAVYGGCVVAIWRAGGLLLAPPSTAGIDSAIGGLIGSFFGGALLVGLVSGARNLFLGAK